MCAIRPSIPAHLLELLTVCTCYPLPTAAASVAPVHLLELLVVVVICGLLISRTLAVGRGP